MRAAIVMLLFQLQTSPCEDEMVLRWNAFANYSNEYVRTRPASDKERQKRKKHLKELFEQAYDCPCF